jgi:CBS-domain-containing membrane protein
VACLAEHRVTALPVVDDQGLVLGVVSEADLLLKEEFPHPDQDLPLVWTRRRRRERAKAAASTAGDLMTVAVVSISGEATVAEAARGMHTAGVKRLPVVDERGRLVGIISRADLLKVFRRPDEDLRREILDQVLMGQFALDPSRFLITVHDGVVTSRAGSSSVACCPGCCGPSRRWKASSGSRTGSAMTSTTCPQ